MSWRVAKSLLKLREQINAAYPARDKASDGTIGDARHRASKSDHNPNRAGVVQAMDIDKDLSPTVKINGVVDALVKSRDKRIKYLIWRGQIMSSVQQPWVWRKYNGTNGHFEHVHISVMDSPALYDDDSAWQIGSVASSDVEPFSTVPTEQTARTLLREGMRGDDVAVVQKKLIALGILTATKPDGIFGPKTKTAVMAFQRRHKLTADGIVGPKTLAKLPK